MLWAVIIHGAAKATKGYMVNRFITCTALALIVGLSTVSCGRPKNSEQVITRTASSVQGFELRHTNLRENERAHFSVGYAIWANYPYIVFEGETYERAGIGGVIIRANEQRPTRYLVDETMVEHDSGEVWKSRLSITDKETGEVIASRWLHHGQSEDNSGWVGQHAAKFVRTVLATDAPIGGAVGVKRYPRAPSVVEPEEAVAVPKNDPLIVGCPATYKIDSRRHVALDTGIWRFKPQAPLTSVACSGGRVMVLSDVYADDLYIDVLSQRGELLFQSELDLPKGDAAAKGRMDRVSMKGSILEFHLNHWIWTNVNHENVPLPYRAYRVRFDMDLGCKKSGPCAPAG